MDKQGKRKKYQDIADLILADIKNGIYNEGDNIPPIRKLAQKYDVNPQTVNKATSHLATLGYLEARQGSGSVVTEPKNGESGKVFIPMLIDSFRSAQFDQPDNSLSHHSKDIYLSYLMNMNKAGYRAKFYVYDQDALSVNTAIPRDAGEIDGVIVQGSMPNYYFSWFAKRDIPVVLINRKPPEGLEGRFASVVIDIENIGQMVNYLVSLNHKNILFCQSDEYEENFVYGRRYDAAVKALGEWSHDFDVHLKKFRFNSGSRDSLKLFKSFVKEGYSAAFCFNDVSALGLFSLVQKAGLRIPYDFSIAGFDDIFAAQLATPPLTTIRVNRPAMVQMALELMEELRVSSAPVYLEKNLPTELVLRKSTFTKS